MQHTAQLQLARAVHLPNLCAGLVAVEPVGVDPATSKVVANIVCGIDNMRTYGTQPANPVVPGATLQSTSVSLSPLRQAG